MKVLLAVTCLVAVVFSSQDFELEAGAKRGTFLNEIQQELITTYRDIFPDGRRIVNTAGLDLGKNDLCKINNEDFQSRNSIVLGRTCKKAFVQLYNEEPDRCGGVFCDVVSNVESFLNDTLRALIAAEYDKDFFNIVEEEVINPAMDYSCKCMGKMIDAWLGCKHNIGEAEIWYTLMNFVDFDTTADYLGGEDWKDYWVDVVKDRLPWDDIEMLVDRTIANLCQRNTDKRGDNKCYSYFYEAFTTLYQWYLKSSGSTPAVRKSERGRVSDAPEHCTMYDFSSFAEMELEDISFGDIKEAVVEKFCVEDCSDLYQDTFLGCCTASMIQDTDLEDAVMNTAEGIADIYVEVYPEEEEAADSGISTYFGYYEDAMAMLRDPTCDETDVSYDVTPCTEGDAGGDDEEEADPCEGLSGKQLKICKRRQKKKGKGGKGKGGRGGRGREEEA